MKKVLKTMKDCFDTQFFTALLLPDTEQLRRVYSYELYSSEQRFPTAFLTNNCTIEARFYLSGSTVLAGLPYDAVPGDDVKAKRRFLSAQTIDVFRTLLTNNIGFVAVAKEPHTGILVIPSGFFLLEASAGARCLRWGVSADAGDSSRVKTMLEVVTDVYTELRGNHQPYMLLLEYLGSS